MSARAKQAGFVLARPAAAASPFADLAAARERAAAINTAPSPTPPRVRRVRPYVRKRWERS